MDLTAINKINRGGYLPTKKISELPNNQEFKVTALRKVTTKFGDRIVAHLDDEFQIFLSKRVSEALSADDKLLNQMKTTNNLLLASVNSCVEFKNQCK